MFLGGDALIWAFALFGAFLIRFDGEIPGTYLRRLPLVLLIFIPPKMLWDYIYRLHRVTWRLVGLTDLVNVLKANALGSLCAIAALIFLRSSLALGSLPRSVLLLDFMLSVIAITLFRFARRLWDFQRDGMRRSRRRLGTSRRILLVGAGAAGERLAWTMLEDPQGTYLPVGLIDDDPNKHGTYVHGLSVFGGRLLIPDVVRQQKVEEIVIAIPSASSTELRSILDAARGSDVRHIRVLPGVHELLSRRPRLQDIREVNLEDLLGRAPVTIEVDAIAQFLAGKRVMVTGAAGSIGSELVRQLTRFPCAEILAVDINESGLFDLEEAALSAETRVPVRAVVADIRDRDKVDWMFRTLQPRVIFHAAAYKHVPLMERNAEEAVKTNILGTFVLAETAVRTGVETFVLISTDKAVYPNNVMGATKRVAERVIQALGGRGRTHFLAVRFGNVLGSRGSLIPVIQEQIRQGGPIMLTHPDMRRYFMSTAEAVLLVLQAALTDRQVGLFVLDMGEPIRIVDLAVELIRLSGLEPDKDIPFVYTGVRPGEKIEEELAESDEVLLPTRFQKIYEIKPDGAPGENHLRLALQEIERLIRSMDSEGIRSLLAHLATREWSHSQAGSGIASASS
jgi:FlaA1/EpsC-like NDP-sugar epimerase